MVVMSVAIVVSVTGNVGNSIAIVVAAVVASGLVSGFALHDAENRTIPVSKISAPIFFI
jgi:hypothetical protein